MKEDGRREKLKASRTTSHLHHSDWGCAAPWYAIPQKTEQSSTCKGHAQFPGRYLWQFLNPIISQGKLPRHNCGGKTSTVPLMVPLQGKRALGKHFSGEGQDAVLAWAPHSQACATLHKPSRDGFNLPLSPAREALPCYCIILSRTPWVYLPHWGCKVQ